VGEHPQRHQRIGANGFVDQVRIDRAVPVLDLGQQRQFFCRGAQDDQASRSGKGCASMFGSGEDGFRCYRRYPGRT